MQTISLNTLRFGHEATPPMNARLTGRQSEVSELGASIMAHGLIQALTVSEQDGQFYVVDGNRRLAALRHLSSQGAITGDHPVRCDLDGGSGIEVSLAANVMRLPMHEADIYVTMRDLAAAGLSEDDIAGRFGIEKKRVRRMLALGALAPVVLDAWREKKINVDEVRAFTLAENVEAQETAFASLGGGKRPLHAHAIRNALGADNDLRNELKLVSLDEYRAAGGHVVEDLFGDRHNLGDPELMRKLAKAKVASLVADLEAEGWSWVALGETLPITWEYGWSKLTREEVLPTSDEAALLKRLKKKIDAANPGVDDDELPEEAAYAALNKAIEQRGWTDEIKAKSGAVVHLSYSGDLQVKLGVIKPIAMAKGAASKDADGNPAEAGEDAASISMALQMRLSEQLTSAAQQALLSHPNAALAAMVAAITTSNSIGQPISLVFHQNLKKSDETFHEVFVRCLAMRDQELIMAFASAIAPAVDMRIVYGRGHTEKPPVLALIEALDQAPLREQSALAGALLQHFDAADYFGSAPKGAIVTAIREAVSDEEAKRMAGSKKKELVTYALARVAVTGWLPPELRTASYGGPQLDSKAA